MKQVFSSGIVIVDGFHAQREYLLLHYRANHWDLPKGKIEKGETKEQAALRELKEETGLTAQLLPGFQEMVGYWFRDYKQGELAYKTVYFFVGQANEKHVVISDEHIGYVWLPYQAAIERLSYDNAKELIKKAESFIDTAQAD